MSSVFIPEQDFRVYPAGAGSAYLERQSATDAKGRLGGDASAEPRMLQRDVTVPFSTVSPAQAQSGPPMPPAMSSFAATTSASGSSIGGGLYGAGLSPRHDPMNVYGGGVTPPSRAGSTSSAPAPTSPTVPEGLVLFDTLDGSSSGQLAPLTGATIVHRPSSHRLPSPVPPRPRTMARSAAPDPTLSSSGFLVASIATTGAVAGAAPITPRSRGGSGTGLGLGIGLGLGLGLRPGSPTAANTGSLGLGSASGGSSAPAGAAPSPSPSPPPAAPPAVVFTVSASPLPDAAVVSTPAAAPLSGTGHTRSASTGLPADADAEGVSSRDGPALHSPPAGSVSAHSGSFATLAPAPAFAGGAGSGSGSSAVTGLHEGLRVLQAEQATLLAQADELHAQQQSLVDALEAHAALEPIGDGATPAVIRVHRAHTLKLQERQLELQQHQHMLMLQQHSLQQRQLALQQTYLSSRQQSVRAMHSASNPNSQTGSPLGRRPAHATTPSGPASASSLAHGDSPYSSVARHASPGGAPGPSPTAAAPTAAGSGTGSPGSTALSRTPSRTGTASPLVAFRALSISAASAAAAITPPNAGTAAATTATTQAAAASLTPVAVQPMALSPQRSVTAAPGHVVSTGPAVVSTGGSPPQVRGPSAVPVPAPVAMPTSTPAPAPTFASVPMSAVPSGRSPPSLVSMAGQTLGTSRVGAQPQPQPSPLQQPLHPLSSRSTGSSRPLGLGRGGLGLAAGSGPSAGPGAGAAPPPAAVSSLHAFGHGHGHGHAHGHGHGLGLGSYGGHGYPLGHSPLGHGGHTGLSTSGGSAPLGLGLGLGLGGAGAGSGGGSRHGHGHSLSSGGSGANIGLGLWLGANTGGNSSGSAVPGYGPGTREPHSSHSQMHTPGSVAGLGFAQQQQQQQQQPQQPQPQQQPQQQQSQQQPPQFIGVHMQQTQAQLLNLATGPATQASTAVGAAAAAPGAPVGPAASGTSPQGGHAALRGAAASSAAAPSGGADVLLVEDVRVSSKVAELALRRERFTTMLVESGPDAVAAAKRHTFRVILMDIHLPGMSGIEATRLIREHEAANGRSPVLVLALTGNVAASDLETYRAVGIDGCIAKGRLLGDALQKALRANQAHPGKFVSIIDNDVKVY